MHHGAMGVCRIGHSLLIIGEFLTWGWGVGCTRIDMCTVVVLSHAENGWIWGMKEKCEMQFFTLTLN